MTMQISTNNRILIDGEHTGLAVTQRRNQTVVYTPEKAGGGGYQEHTMPHVRYSTAHEAPRGPATGTNWRGRVTTQEMADQHPKTAGSLQFETDIRELLKRL